MSHPTAASPAAARLAASSPVPHPRSSTLPPGGTCSITHCRRNVSRGTSAPPAAYLAGQVVALASNSRRTWVSCSPPCRGATGRAAAGERAAIGAAGSVMAAGLRRRLDGGAHRRQHRLGRQRCAAVDGAVEGDGQAALALVLGAAPAGAA